MKSPVISFVSAVTGVEQSPGDPVWVVVSRRYAYLADLLARAFKDREDVKIIVDRRYGERRTRQQPVAVERRRTERRRPREEVVVVVLGSVRRLETPGGGPA